jgi:hypothetical protein
MGEIRVLGESLGQFLAALAHVLCQILGHRFFGLDRLDPGGRQIIAKATADHRFATPRPQEIGSRWPDDPLSFGPAREDNVQVGPRLPRALEALWLNLGTAHNPFG